MSHAIQLAAVFELIGQFWLYEVSRDTLNGMRLDGFLRTYEELGGYVPEVVDDHVIDKLATEYCELLIGPKGHLSPVQSVWTTNQFQSESAASMHRFFELLPGYVPQSNLSDHLGVELDFLSALLRTTDAADGSESFEVIEHFAKTHLAWSFRFLEQVNLQSNSMFYRGLANVTSKLVDNIVNQPKPSL